MDIDGTFRNLTRKLEARVTGFARPLNASDADRTYVEVVVAARTARQYLEYFHVDTRSEVSALIAKPAAGAMLRAHDPGTGQSVFEMSDRSGTYLWRMSQQNGAAETLVATNTFPAWHRAR